MKNISVLFPEETLMISQNAPIFGHCRLLTR